MVEDKFRFRRHDNIGAEAAEEDVQFLANCFVDIGDIDALVDCSNAISIILGRTGVGKTALLEQLAKNEDAISIRPESLSFNYLANSSILQFFLEAGVKLDLFFKLLWRHVFTVELIKRKYNITNEITKMTFLERFENIFTKDKKKERAISYLRKWGDKFWEPTEYRIKEITGKIEDELRTSIGTKLSPVELNASAASKLTAEQKIEVVQRGQEVINEIQMRELTDVLEFLNEDVFHDDKQHFYVCVDKLDENWVDEKFRYLLIRSLIETIKDFRRVRNIKIIIVLRVDLVERVIRLTRDTGFQEEKFRSLFLNLKWSEGQLKDLLNKRVNYLVKQRYTNQAVGFKDLLPPKIERTPSIQYMIDRTLMRPRELIEFFNECIEKSEGKTIISKTALLTAEGEYSKKRLRSLQDEWVSDYPSLADLAFILRKSPKQFRVGDLNEEAIQDFLLDYVIKHSDRDDFLSLQVRNTIEGSVPLKGFIATLLHVFYKTGLVGLKIETYETTQWSYDGPSVIASDIIDEDTRVKIHPTFYRVLGIKP